MRDRAISPEPSADPVTLRQLVLLFTRRWRVFAGVWALVVAATAVYTFAADPLFRPQATLEIRPETPLVSADPNDPTTAASRTLWESYYRTQEAILTSPGLLEATLQALPEALRAKYADVADPVVAFGKSVQVEKSRSSFILAVGFADKDAEAATAVVNTLVDLYLEDASRQLQEKRSDAAEVLSKETLPKARRQVEEADAALQSFLKANGFIDPQEQYGTLVEARRTILKRITDVRLRRLQVDAELRTLESYAADPLTAAYNPAFHRTKAVENLTKDLETLEGEVRRQEQELLDDHPVLKELRGQVARLQAKLRSAVEGTLTALRKDLASVEAEEKGVEQELQLVEKDMAAAAERVARVRRLEAELATAREVYAGYLKKHGETSASSSARLGSVRVIDRAKPPKRPWKPNVPLNLALGALLGTLLGLGAVMATEQLDDRLLTPQEVEAFVRVNVLAVVPRLSSPSDAPALLADGSPMPEFEAFRALRAEVATRLEKSQGARVVGVLSSMSSEGKSTISANLAKVFAMEGRRVLLFDADMRRPSMLPHFGAPGAAGLEDVLSGASSLDSALRPSRIPGVDLLGMRQGTSRAGELATSRAYDDLFRTVRERYDIVIVDSAPVNQVSESALVARRCDLAVLVVRQSRTGRGAAVAARRRLESMDVPLAGAVFNDASARSSGYGYYGYYGYGESRS